MGKSIRKGVRVPVVSVSKDEASCLRLANIRSTTSDGKLLYHIHVMKGLSGVLNLSGSESGTFSTAVWIHVAEITSSEYFLAIGCQ